MLTKSLWALPLLVMVWIPLRAVSAFDWDTANTCVLLCANAYCPTSTYETRNYNSYAEGFVATYTIDNKEDVQGFVGYMDSQKAIYVAYRGSESIEDWANNLDAWKVDYPSCSGCEVHEGFYDAEQSAIGGVKTEVQNLKNKYPSYKVIVTGHSLGAAMALLTALDLQKSGIVQSGDLRLFDFGCPRVGNNNFAEWASTYLNDRNRVTHHKDMVLHLPTYNMGFEHISGEYYYEKDSASDLHSCSGYEDPDCSYQWVVTNIDDHLHYLDYPISNCPPQSTNPNLRRAQ